MNTVTELLTDMERFTLYKKDQTNKWVQYGGGEIYSIDPKCFRYQHALRLVERFGWEAYRVKNIPGIHAPLHIQGSYEELERMILESDPLSLTVGKSMKEFINNQHPYGKIARQKVTKEIIHQRALQQARVDYEANRYVLPHLLEELGFK